MYCELLKLLKMNKLWPLNIVFVYAVFGFAFFLFLWSPGRGVSLVSNALDADYVRSAAIGYLAAFSLVLASLALLRFWRNRTTRGMQSNNGSGSAERDKKKSEQELK